MPPSRIRQSPTGHTPRAPHSPRPPRRRYHFGSPGLVYILVTLLLALGAFNSQNNLLFWAFGFSLALLVVSGFLSGAMLMGIEVQRERVEDAECGGQLVVRYRVRNRNTVMPAFALTIEELPVLAAGTTSRIEQPRAFIVHVGPRSSARVDVDVKALHRGAVGFRAFVVHTSFPFGLIRKSLLFEETAGAVILPARVEADPGAFTGAARTGMSDRAGRRRGRGDEFHSLREYNAGDSPRAIAWKASARRGSLLVRQSLAPAPKRAWVVLRLRVAGGRSALDERAISLAAAAIRHAQSLNLAVGLAVPLVGVIVPPNPHPGHALRLIRELGLIELGAENDRGAGTPFPHIQSAREAGQCFCIHAGPVDPAFAPGDRVTEVVHLSASDPGAQLDREQVPAAQPIRELSAA